MLFQYLLPLLKVCVAHIQANQRNVAARAPPLPLPRRCFVILKGLQKPATQFERITNESPTALYGIYRGKLASLPEASIHG